MSLEFFKKLFGAVILISVLYAAISFLLADDRQAGSGADLAVQGADPGSGPRSAVKDKKDYSLFLTRAEAENIFVSEQVPAASPEAGGKAVGNAVAGLRLVGILQDPEKVVIEDTKSGTVFRVGMGETFLGGLQIKKIGIGSVTISAGGKNFDLYL